jgi:predicted sugar kinase
LIDAHHDGALRLGLIDAIFDDDYENLVANLNNFKRDLRNGEEGKYFKNEIQKIVAEIVENFKQSTRITSSIN